MAATSLGRITVDGDIPEYMAGVNRCGSVVAEEKDGETIKDYQELVDNKEFHSEIELVSFVAQKLGVSETIIRVES